MAESILHWRLLEDGIEDPFLHFAVEETLLRRVAEGLSRPTLRLRRTVPSVWIGVYQDAREEVDIDYCRAHGLPVIRRPNPGGAVYQDRGTFCTSAFFPRSPTFEALGIRETGELYGLMGRLVEAWCAGFGVTAAAAPVNDVQVGNRKVYGSAQIELGDAVVHSGTFLVHADLEVMAAALRPPRLKLAGKGIAGVRDRVVNLAEAAGRALSVPEAMAGLIRTLEARLPVQLDPGPLTGAERRDAEGLLRKKYAQEEWTFPRRRPFATSLATKAASGLVLLDLALDGDRIEAIDVRGDFLLERQDALVDLLRGAQGMSLTQALGLLRASPLPGDFQDALAHLLQEASRRGAPTIEAAP